MLNFTRFFSKKKKFSDPKAVCLGFNSNPFHAVVVACLWGHIPSRTHRRHGVFVHYTVYLAGERRFRDERAYIQGVLDVRRRVVVDNFRTLVDPTRDSFLKCRLNVRVISLVSIIILRFKNIFSPKIRRSSSDSVETWP